MTQRRPQGSNMDSRKSSSYGQTGRMQSTHTQSSRTQATRTQGTQSSSSRAVRSSTSYRTADDAMAARREARLKQKKKKQAKKIITIAAIAAAIVIVAVIAIVIISASSKNSSSQTDIKTVAADGSTEIVTSAGSGTNESADEPETEPPTEAYVVSSATIGAAGDILTHNSVMATAFDGDSSYSFANNFASVAPYWSALDYMIINLEVPCSGSQGEKGSQYPTFDAPDSIVSDLMNAGVDMFLTATNHTYDCRDDGLLNTQNVINSLGADHIGTRLSSSENYYLIKDINGIKFGMNCYTYDTREEITDDLSLNTIYVNDETSDLVNSFCYSDAGLELLYSQISSDIAAMDAAGCDVKVFFMHWGTEYQDAPSDFIRGIAQKISDLGADLIIGGHPHVIQPFEVLTGANGNTTYCLYSTGNCISSQRKAIMNEDDYRGYTEDGLTISFTYDKYSDGTTKLSDVFVLPTWVDADAYTVVPLDASLSTDQWATAYTSEAVESYNRTLGRVGQAYADLRAALGKEAVPAEVY